MRESADYRSTLSKEGADNLIKTAYQFLTTAKKLLKKWAAFQRLIFWRRDCDDQQSWGIREEWWV